MIEMLRRREMMAPSKSILPSEYQQVEYLESTGGAYIDTRYRPFDNFDVESINIWSKVNADNFWLCGAVNLSTFRQDIGIGRNAQRIYGYSTFNVLSSDVFYKIELTTTTVSINNEKSTLIYQGDNNYPSGLSFLLFKANGSILGPKGKIYYCKIVTTQSGTYEFIPCYRIADNVAGMYDIVNNMFYTNAGTGEFLVGADVIG